MTERNGTTDARPILLLCGALIVLGCGVIMPISALLEPRTSGPILTPPSAVDALSTRLLQMVSMGAGLLALLRGNDGGASRRQRWSDAIFGSLLLWMLTRLMADLHAGTTHVSLLMAMFVTTAFAFVSHSIDLPLGMFLMVTRVYALGSVLLAILMPAQSFCVVTGDDRRIFGLMRMCGLTGQPNTLGEIAGIALLLELSNLNRGRRGLRLLFGAAALASLLLSQSRTAWMAAILAGLTIAFWYISRAGKGGGSLFLLALVGLVSAMFLLRPRLAANLLSPQTTAALGTVNGREIIWSTAMAQFHRSPVFGYGLNIYNAAFTAGHLPYGLQMVRDSHSQFVQTLAESGIVGFVGLMGFLLVYFAGAIFRWRKDSPYPLALGIFMVFRCFTESGLMVDGVGWQLWCILALAGTLVVTDRPKPDRMIEHLTPLEAHVPIG